MNVTTYYVFLGVAVGVILFSLLFTILYMRKQQYKETDDDVSDATVKHPMLLNPALIMYVLFPAVIVVGAYLYYTYVIH